LSGTYAFLGESVDEVGVGELSKFVDLHFLHLAYLINNKVFA